MDTLPRRVGEELLIREVDQMLFKTAMKTPTANILVQKIKIYLYGTCLFSVHVSVLLPTYFWIQAAPGNVSSRERNSKRKILPSTSFFFFYPRVLLYVATIVKKLTAKTSSS